jgi:hypothetical protein
MSILYRGPSKDASYQISIHLAKWLQRRSFLERCSSAAKSCDFWKTMKPFFSKKSNAGEQK